MREAKTEAAFIEPMLLLRTERLPEGPGWLVELKFDGYRALEIRNGGKVRLRSRNDKDFTSRYPAIVKALAAMPEGTVIDGEIVALDQNGKPSFSLLQNYGSAVDALALACVCRPVAHVGRILKAAAAKRYRPTYDNIVRRLVGGKLQKCLIHLMRDINDDLRKQPFNEEMKTLANAFAELLRAIVITVDRFGLKGRYLLKHKSAAEAFLGALRKTEFQTEIAVAYIETALRRTARTSSHS